MENTELPNDTESLKSIIQDYQQQVSYLEEKVSFLEKAIFGQKSEKRQNLGYNEKQLPLPGFSEEASQEPPKETITVPEHTRKKRGRKPLPDNIPRENIYHDISEDEKDCACGSSLSHIGEEVSEKLDYVPAKLKVQRHVRYKYACRNCEGVESDQGAVKIASLPPQIIPQGIVSPGLLAHMLTAKFVDALPFYRQEKQFERLGVDISRSTMTSWAMSVATACETFRDLFRQEILSGFLINIDETRVQVLKEKDKSNSSQSYMWAFLGGNPERPTVLFDYHPTRSRKALEFLEDYKGYIQTDGYVSYDALGDSPNITHIGCLAHIRRKFMDVLKISKRARKRGGTAQDIVDLIGQLYNLEKNLAQQKLEPDRIQEQREEHALPILNQIKSILDQRVDSTPPKSKLGTAINYALNQWDRVVRYVWDGRLRPDNNLVENSIRPIAMGRKNWLFAGHPNGANAGALFFSIIETAKMNNLEPYAYLRYLFENLPLASTEEEIKMLMPQYIDRTLIPSPLAS